MSDTRTPGQIAYAAYWQVHAQEGYVKMRIPFRGMPDVSQRAWEAAAQAAITAWIASPDWPTPATKAQACRHCQGEDWYASCAFCAGSGQEDTP